MLYVVACKRTAPPGPAATAPAATRASEARGEASEAERKARAELEANVTLVVEDQPLEKVLRELLETHGINYSVDWRALEALGLTKQAAVSGRYHDVPVRKALRGILADAGPSAGLDYRVDDGVVVITTKTALQKSAPQAVRVYDIRDLLVPLDGAQGEPPSLDLAKATSGGHMEVTPGKSEYPVDQRAAIVREITATIEETVAPDSWRQYGGVIGSIRELNGQFIINQTVENHAAIEGLLGQLREARAIQISFEARMLTVDEATYKSLPLPASDKKDQILGAVLSAQQLETILRTVQDAPTAAVLSLPRVTLFNGQPGYVGMTKQRNFVANYGPTTLPSGKVEMRPRVSTLTTGIIFQVEATVSADRRFVVAKLKPQLSTLDGLDRWTEGGDSEAAKTQPTGPYVDLPKITYTTVNAMLSIPDGGTAVLGGQVVPAGIESKELAGGASTQPGPRILLILVRPKISVAQTAAVTRPGL
jgi:type II secretory pathway component GspD/PulD (secretin)